MNEQYILFPGDSEWRIAAVREDGVRLGKVAMEESAEPDSRAQAVRESLLAEGYADQPVVLALHSARCLSAVFPTDTLERKGRRRAMGFLLEEHVPISIEQVVADYVESGGEALGVCSELAPLEATVNALESCGIAVRHICPTALLVAAGAAAGDPELDGAVIGPDGGAGSGDGYDVVCLRSGVPARWSWLAGDGPIETDPLEACGVPSEPARLTLVGCGDAAGEIGQSETVEVVKQEDAGRYEAAALHAARLLDESASPCIDLRRGALAAPNAFRVYRRSVSALVTLAVALLVSIAVVAHWRGRAYEQLTAANLRRQAAVFREALPDQRVPGVSIKRRLLSERRKLAGLGGRAMEGEDEGPTVRAPSALEHLYGVLESLPADLRFRVLVLNIQPDLVRMEGQARSHADADRIAAALRATGRYQVAPPETRALKDRGVSFEFAAHPRIQLSGREDGR